MDREKKTNIITIAAGVITIVMALVVLLMTQNEKLHNTLEVTGTVTAWEVETDYDPSTEVYEEEYYPVLRYEVNGTVYEERYSQCYSKEEYAVGEEIALMADPENPERFTIKADDRGTFIVLWMFPVGIALCLLPLLKKKFRKKEEEQ